MIDWRHYLATALLFVSFEGMFWTSFWEMKSNPWAVIGIVVAVGFFMGFLKGVVYLVTEK